MIDALNKAERTEHIETVLTRLLETAMAEEHAQQPAPHMEDEQVMENEPPDYWWIKY